MVDLQCPDPVETIVAHGVEMEDVEARAQDRDERQEPVAVQPVPVEIVGMPVRGRDHDDPAVEHAPEQPRDQHRVGDVPDLELVEAQQPVALRHHGCDRADRFRPGVGTAPCVDQVVRLLHEGVEMHPAFALDGDGVVKQVHQHRLAAPDAAVDVETARRTNRPPAPGEPVHNSAERTGRNLRAPCTESDMEGLQPFDRTFLRRIRLQDIGLEQGSVATERILPGRHPYRPPVMSMIDPAQ